MEYAEVIGYVVGNTESGPNDDGTDTGLLENPTRGNIRDVDAVFVGNGGEGAEEGLEVRPWGPGQDHVEVLEVLISECSMIK